MSVNKYIQASIAGCLLVWLSYGLFFYCVGRTTGQHNSIHVEHTIQAPTLYRAEAIPISIPVYGPVYRFSLVSGGVKTLDELQRLIDDPVLRAAYSSFDFSSAHRCIAERDEKSY